MLMKHFLQLKDFKSLSLFLLMYPKQQDVKPTSRKLNDVLQMAQQLGKRRSEHVGAVLSSLVAEAKKDYVDGTQKIDATPSEIEVELKKIDKQQPSRRVFPQRPSDLQILHMPKLKALYDHRAPTCPRAGTRLTTTPS